MKKIIALLLVGVMALSITACTKENSEPPVEEIPPVEETPVTPEGEEDPSGAGKDPDAAEETLLQFIAPAEDAVMATMKTNMGEIEILLFPEQAPLTVENFVTHAVDGYYDGIIFHRVIEDFMIQGGDPTGTGMGGESIYSDESGTPVSFEDEFSDKLLNFRGALSMANAGPATNGSQFFIVQAGVDAMGDLTEEDFKQANFPQNVAQKYLEIGGTPHLDFKHTVFGQVTNGMDVVDSIATVEKGSADKPVDDVIIESITIKNNPYTK